jgi:hypothetical protein
MGNSVRRRAPVVRGKGGSAQLERVRRHCLSIPGTVEKISHGEPTFFTPKRVFVMFANNHHGDGRIAVWVPAAPGVQAALIEEAPAAYFRPPYVGLGRGPAARGGRRSTRSADSRGVQSDLGKGSRSRRLIAEGHA